MQHRAVAGALVAAMPDALKGSMAERDPADDIPMAGSFEADLMAVGRERDRAAFARLFEHYAPRLKSFLRRGRLSEAALDDLVQDVFVNLWRRASTYDPVKASASTWIYTIARNRRIDLARRARPEVDLDDPALVIEEADDAPLPDEATGQGEMARLLGAAVADLPPEQSDIVSLAYYKDMSHSEIAAELDLPLGTVKSRLRLALGKLRQNMDGLD